MVDLIPIHAAQNSDVAFIFVHGFRSSSHDTWTGKSSVCWTHRLAEATDASVYHFEYPNDIEKAASLRHEAAADHLKNKLHQLSPQHRYFIIVTHSFGGLVTKQCIVNAATSGLAPDQDLLDRISGVTMLSCPNRGHAFARLRMFIPFALKKPAANIEFLKKNGDQIIELHEDFLQVMNSSKTSRSVKTFGENVPLFFGLFRVRAKDSKLSITGAQHLDLQKNHSTICKNLQPDDTVFVALTDQIKQVRRKLSLQEPFIT